jgi:hypothetical protein
MLWWKEGVLSLLPCKLAAVENALVEEGVIPAAMQARCCDSQNALVRRVLSLRCHAQAAVMIHRMPVEEEGVLSLRCHASSLLL